MPTTSDYGGIPQTASPASNSGQQIVIMAMWSSEPPESHDHDRARGGRRAARCAKPGKYVETAASRERPDRRRPFRSPHELVISRVRVGQTGQIAEQGNRK